MPDDRLEKSHLQFADAAGSRTRYYTAGEGDPLLLLHGGEFGSVYSLDCWSLNLGGLARDFRVVALDRLGQGHTANPPAADAYTYEAVLAHVIAFVETLALGPVHVAGHSRGGLVAASLALARPDLVRSLVIVSSATLAEDPSLSTARFYDEIGRPGGRIPAGQPVTAGAARVEADAQAYNPSQVTDDFVRRMTKIAQLTKTSQAAAVMDKHETTVWQPSLNAERARVSEAITSRGLPVPTLVFWGANDRSAPVALAYRVFERLCPGTPASELHVVNGAGHYCFRDQPAAFERALRGFCLAA